MPSALTKAGVFRQAAYPKGGNQMILKAGVNVWFWEAPGAAGWASGQH